MPEKTGLFSACQRRAKPLFRRHRLIICICSGHWVVAGRRLTTCPVQRAVRCLPGQWQQQQQQIRRCAELMASPISATSSVGRCCHGAKSSGWATGSSWAAGSRARTVLHRVPAPSPPRASDSDVLQPCATFPASLCVRADRAAGVHRRKAARAPKNLPASQPATALAAGMEIGGGTWDWMSNWVYPLDCPPPACLFCFPSCLAIWSPPSGTKGRQSLHADDPPPAPANGRPRRPTDRQPRCRRPSRR